MLKHRLIWLIIIASCLLGIYFLDPDIFLQLKTYIFFGSLEQTAGFLRSKGLTGILISITIIILNSLFPFSPFIIIAGANALVFGMAQGFIISLLGAVLGAVIAYWMARILGRDFFAPRLSTYSIVQRFQSDQHAFRLILILRLIPIFPSFVINYGVAISPIRFRTFFMATLLGKIPIIAWHTVVSHDILNISQKLPRLIFVLVATVLFFVIMWRIYNKVIKE